MSARTPSSGDASIARSSEGTSALSLIPRWLDLTGRVVLMATDGSPCAVAAARVARALAARHGAAINVVSIVDTRSAPMPPPIDIALAMGDAVVGPELHREQEAAIRADLSGALGETIDWPVRIKLGTPAAAVVREAQRVGAALIVMGLRRHGRFDRAFQDETTLNVMRAAACPVLGVVAETSELPRRILAAVDFGQGSLVALGAGRAVAGPNATLVLAYVQSMPYAPGDEGEARIHEMGVQAGFRALARELVEDGIAAEHAVLDRAVPQSPGQRLLDYADEVGSDLITAGSLQHGRLERWVLGSVSTELVRDGRRSVLIVPPSRQS